MTLRVASLLGGLYERVADEVAATCPTGTILEAASEPGRLAVLLEPPGSTRNCGSADA
jgi:hypothetical protein